MASEAQNRAVKKYLADKVEVRLWTTQPVKERIQQAAQEAGQSVAAYILEAVDRRIAEDQNIKP